MSILKSIRLGSAFKVGLVAYAIVGLVLGVICSVFAMAGHAHLGIPRAAGMFAVVFCPIVYGLAGGIASVIGALLYNLAASWVGGVEVELS
jgi:hypothetical protein